MSRSERLLDLLQVLRRHRRPVSGRRLAEETGVSLRTLYRDIATLNAQGAGIEGEAGLGYVLRPGFLLPPLMLSQGEIEALVLGSRWVLRQGDEDLAFAARNALAKISAVLPDALRDEVEASTLLIGPSAPPAASRVELSLLRDAISRERRLSLLYTDAADVGTQRIVWPFALGFFDRMRILVAWCEARQAFRHFRTDRMAKAEVLEERYPRRRAVLLKEWREEQGIAPD